MLALLAAVLVSTPYVPVTCQTGYVATYRGGRVQCVNSILQATASGTATTATTALGLTCSSACVQDSEIQSVAASKTTGWPTCTSGQALTAAGSTPACTSAIKASDLACTECVSAEEISGFDLGDATDTAAGELYESHEPTAITLTEPTSWYWWSSGGAGVCVRMRCEDGILEIIPDGVYRVSVSFSGSIDAASQLVEMHLFVNDEDTGNCAISTKFAARGDEQPAGFTCLLQLFRGDTLAVKFKNVTSSGKTLTIQHMNLNASRVL